MMNLEQIINEVDKAIDPEEMTGPEAVTFLSELISHLNEKLETLNEELDESNDDSDSDDDDINEEC